MSERERKSMRITRLHIWNFKSLRDLRAENVERALVLVGRNNTGKSSVLESVKLALSGAAPKETDYGDYGGEIRIGMTLELTAADLSRLYQDGCVSGEREEEAWQREFGRRLNADGNNVIFEYRAEQDQKRAAYFTGDRENPAVREIFPEVIAIGSDRDPQALEQSLLWLQADEDLKLLKDRRCLLDPARLCRHTFTCIPQISEKTAGDLNAAELCRLFEYRMSRTSAEKFAGLVNDNYRRNGGQDTICYRFGQDLSQMLRIRSEIEDSHTRRRRPASLMGNGMKSIYLLSLLETYAAMSSRLPAIFLLDEPETFLHPQLQKTAGDILYRLSRKNQVIFTTHASNLLSNFSSREIRQMVLDENGDSCFRPETDCGAILSDLGYTVGDMLNRDFVFIVEGRQDKDRLPLILRHYFPVLSEPDGKPERYTIITTNSCTNIETYAHLKYMNQVYLGDRFLMIRDGDGKNADDLRTQLCGYYNRQRERDADGIPSVTEKNVLILRYYSFENYFMNPAVMAEIGVLKREEDFYRIFLENWRDGWKRTTAGVRLRQMIGRDLRTSQDVKDHLEDIRRYLRGHDLFDVFYAPWKGGKENAILAKYIAVAPRREFADILDAVERFDFFRGKESRRARRGTAGSGEMPAAFRRPAEAGSPGAGSAESPFRTEGRRNDSGGD